MNWIKKENVAKITEWVLIIFLVGILIAPIVYIIKTSPDETFWDNSIGNLLATVLALIAGIPVAFVVDRSIQKRQNEEKFKRERIRESEILKVIKEELEFSYKSLFLNGKKGNVSSITIQPLKSDIWRALSASEEIRYIEDINLINRITSAYYVLNLVRDIENQAYMAVRTSAVSVTVNGQKVSSAQLLLRDARVFDTLFEDSIKKAIDQIDKRIKILKRK